MNDPLKPRLLTRRDYDAMMGEDPMGSPATDDETAEAHHGWEVEYLGQPQVVGGGRQSGSCRTQHPAARSYELVSERNETTPTLVLFNEEEEAVAIYNGLSWVACRRIAKPGETV